MLDGLMAAWQIVGQVVERRELTSQKNQTWRGYVVKAASIGLTLEMQVTADDFGKVAQGSVYQFAGRFEDQAGRLKLICERLKPAVAAAGVK